VPFARYCWRHRPAIGALRLEIEVTRQQQAFSTRPSHVRLTLRAVLLDTAARDVIAWREFDESVQTPTDDPVGGAMAARQATQRVPMALAAICAERAKR
jgi:cholesterol transport system auxiliary component